MIMKSKFKNACLVVYIILSSLFINSCKEMIESFIDGQEISGKGTITKAGNEFTIITEDDRQFVPTNLSDEFRIDKLRVEFRGIIHKNPNQYGIDKIEFTYIKKLG